MKSRGVICCVAFAAIAARAYWVPTSIEQLAANSDCVVMGRVTQLAPDTNTARVAVTMEVQNVLKGTNLAGTKVIFDAPFTLHHCVRIHVQKDQAEWYARSTPPAILTPSTTIPGTFEVVCLDSFTTNEICVVFLRYAHPNQATLAMTADSDGKFSIDNDSQTAWRSVMAKGQDSVPLAEFARLVKTSRLPSNCIVVYVTNLASTAIVTNLIPANLPIQLILPRAITR